MTTLARQQQALLSYLFDRPQMEAKNILAGYAQASWLRGMQVYQANGHALARNALRAAYPVLAQLLGDKSFDVLAELLWHADPPRRGDVSQWGGALAQFLHNSEPLTDAPYLQDVAAVEWALHRAAGAADCAVEPESFALLQNHDPAQLHLVLSPGCTILRSPWPVASMVNAHLSGHPTLERVGQMLRTGAVENALVWRVGLKPQLRTAQTAEANLLGALLDGHPFGVALDLAPDLDISDWLPMAVKTGLLLGVRLVPSADSGYLNQTPTRQEIP
jgi:hypothetical protein